MCLRLDGYLASALVELSLLCSFYVMQRNEAKPVYCNVQELRKKQNPRKYTRKFYVQEIRPISPLYKLRTGVVSGAKFPGKHANAAYVHVTCPGGFIIKYVQKYLCPGNMPKKYMPGKYVQIIHVRETCHIRSCRG